MLANQAQLAPRTGAAPCLHANARPPFLAAVDDCGFMLETEIDVALVKACLSLFGYTTDNRPGFWLHDAADYRSARLDDPGLFEGDARQGIAELLGVIVTDAGDDGNERPADVGRIEAASQADFEHRGIDAAPGEVQKTESGD